MPDPTATTPEPTCLTCHKPQSQLPQPLKQCAKCHTQSYCSPDCQKEAWKTHKPHCAQQSATTANGPSPGLNSTSPTSQPSPEDLLTSARQLVSLMTALSHDPNFHIDLRAIPEHAVGLMFIADFVSRTFREYWCPLLPPQVFAELSAELESFHGVPRGEYLRSMAEKFEEVKRRDEGFDKDKWPERVDGEKYGDCVGRTVLAALIITTPSRQDAMGGRYAYQEEVLGACREILPGRS